jgi:hypothetical protein
MDVEKSPCRILTVTGLGSCSMSVLVVDEVEAMVPAHSPLRSGKVRRPIHGNHAHTGRQTALAIQAKPVPTRSVAIEIQVKIPAGAPYHQLLARSTNQAVTMPAPTITDTCVFRESSPHIALSPASGDFIKHLKSGRGYSPARPALKSR